jgi:hypothetical protein
MRGGKNPLTKAALPLLYQKMGQHARNFWDKRDIRNRSVVDHPDAPDLASEDMPMVL